MVSPGGSGEAGALHDIDAWDAWRPDELAPGLARLEAPWAVAAGWAIDLWLGGEPREHEDLEIAAARETFAAVRGALPRSTRSPPAGSATSPGGSGRWTRRRWDGKMWVFRRDPAIRFPVAEVIERTAAGIPCLAPELVLLFKAKQMRERDRLDLARALPGLGRSRRRRLADALRTVHPGREWIALVDP